MDNYIDLLVFLTANGLTTGIVFGVSILAIMSILDIFKEASK